MLTLKDYQDAIAVQNACNLAGVVSAFHRVLEKMADLGTDASNTHPISVLYASKIVHLTGHDDVRNVIHAYDAVDAKIAELKTLKGSVL